MSGCCGGDATLAQIAANAAAGAPLPEAAPMVGDLVRVEYIGDDRGSQSWKDPFDPGWTEPIRLGNNTIDRFKDVTPSQAQWLIDHVVPIRIVPLFDKPDAPAPLPILEQTDVLTPDAQAVKALRPRGRAVQP